jgi:hypothetical protein
MPWYFLSRTKLEASITELRVPDDAGEEEVPRLCLAPTVWQSLLAIGGGSGPITSSTRSRSPTRRRPGSPLMRQ